jgi:RND family efflux transporter MFP subunit
MPSFAKMRRAACALAALLPLASCKPESAAAPAAPAGPIPVRTITLQPAGEAELLLSGVLRAERETPLAFRLTGEVVARPVAAGARLPAGAVIARLDDRELRRALDAAEAQRAAAAAQAETAAREAERREALLARRVISAEAAERARTEARAAAERLRAAEAEAARAALALEHATLRAPEDGVLAEISLEPGQVVAAGQRIGLFAHDGPREAEVFIPETRHAGLAARAEVRLQPDGPALAATLREIAALADPVSRSYRARFTIAGLAPETPVGGTLTVTLRRTTGPALTVPLSAIAENGAGPFLWRIVDGAVQAVPVRVLTLRGEDALIAADLPAGTEVVAFGVHRLAADARVRVLR